MKPAFCKDILDQVSKIAQKIQDPITPGKHKSFDNLDASSAAVGEQLSPEYTGASAPLHSLLSIASLELSSAVTGGVCTTEHYADRTFSRGRMFSFWSVHCSLFMFTLLYLLLYHIWHCTPINYYQGPSSTSFALHLSGFCHKAFQRHVCSTLMGASIRAK